MSDKITLTTSESRQIINMGGPYIGNLLLNNKLIARDCLEDNFIYVEQTQKIYFVKHHDTSGMMSGVFFTISFYSIKEDKLFEYNKHFKMLYLKRIIDDNLEIYPAFHDKVNNGKTLFNLSKEQYNTVSPDL